MSYELVQILVDVAQFVVTGAIGVYVYLVNKNAATNARIDQTEKNVDGRLDNHEQRLSRVEAHVEQLPAHDDLTAVRSDIAATRQSVENVSGQLSQLVNQVGLIQEHLLREARAR